MKKLIIQIPCFNEEASLPTTLKSLPRRIAGVDRVEWLVIDDGSTDKTVHVARESGVDHIVSHSKNMGLARTFMTGLKTCLERGADIIVNTDADNQYRGEDVPKLVQPILDGRAEIVVGERPIGEIEEFSNAKKMFQRLGSWVVRRVSKTEIKDAPSGFRAISADAARKLNVFNNHTYTLETIIQAGQKNIPIVSVPIRTNRSLRPSRLIKSTPGYIARSVVTIIRIFVIYKPFRFFLAIGSILLMMGIIVGTRFLWYYFIGEGSGHIQSLILASILIGIGFQTVMVAFVADLLSVNRRLLEDMGARSIRKQRDIPAAAGHPRRK